MNEAYIRMIREMMREGLALIGTRQLLYYRYLVFTDTMMSMGESEVIEAIRADSFLTMDLYVGLSTLMDWAEGKYELSVGDETRDRLWQGIAYIACGDPEYSYGVREDRRQQAQEMALSFVREDLDDAVGF